MIENVPDNELKHVPLDRNACIDQIIFLDTVATQLKAGLPILDLLANAKSAVPQLGAYVDRMCSDIREGRTMRTAFARPTAAPATRTAATATNPIWL